VHNVFFRLCLQKLSAFWQTNLVVFIKQHANILKMGKATHLPFECMSCGRKYARWEGRCNSCGEWNTIQETKDTEVTAIKHGLSSKSKKITGIDVYKLSEVSATKVPRLTTGSKEFDRVLGGGIVKGSAMLVGGEPGIGKSTLLLQTAQYLSEQYKSKILYVSGEESLEQLKIRAERLNINSPNIYLLTETSLLKAIAAIEQHKPFVCIIDSIQAIYDENLQSPMGSFSQLRQTVSILIELTKKYDIPTFFVGHVTKDGMIAGPKLIEHMVDAVVYFEGDENINYRMLRTIKNRFGPSNEIGIFEMKEAGLEDVTNPSAFFLAGRGKEHTGSFIGSIMTGTRPLLVEIQSLLSSSYLGLPRRTVIGYEANRVAMLLAILEKKFHYTFSNLDLFVNLVGGLKSQDPSLDLAVLSSISSSYLNRKANKDYYVIGEVGLTGEVRKVPRLTERLVEAERVGFKSAIIPKQALDFKGDMDLIRVEQIEEVLDVLYE
jgi:DNA repair protein RadA/Sms